MPAIGIVSEARFAGQPLHNSQLRNVKAVIKRAGDHWQPGSRLLVERPEAQVVTIKIRDERFDRLLEQRLGLDRSSGEEVVIHSPSRPNEAVQNVGGRRNKILFEPEITVSVSERYPALIGANEKTLEGSLGRV